ncbi:hypothetical protein [Gillisia limnaea]|uniref:Uncharacterized protein n=1 Tax=Gillisia limnaea (strain DSM 15749 / LMG 21470 / R-8282) TaxID=865937 RepID=H2BXH6_GILLR|nr:hypothetical protein [Gillisia limnaea]EHQ02058.1 hypothetical protein Gilli_1399 [Gillisia limnaea DSM 15749]
MTAYRENIISTYKYLISIREDLITHSLNIAMTGELKDMDEAFDIGDTYSFDIEQFKGTNDVNLNKLVAFYEELENLMNSLANINAIREEDLSDENEG